MKVPVMMASYLSHTQQGESSADNAEVPAGHAQGDSGVAAPFGRPGPIDIYLQSRAAGPTQPRLKMYPKTMQGKKRRSFNPSWYNMFSWLEYSPMKDSAYCYAYRQFSLPSTSESVFTLEKSKALLLTLHDTTAQVSAPLVPPLSKMSGPAPALHVSRSPYLQHPAPGPQPLQPSQPLTLISGTSEPTTLLSTPRTSSFRQSNITF
uniref:uncharacterized protein isoform X1 n=1 Tax=Semicossyphus pulcher TaxID=241346 RepID=UPI0037E757FD